VSFCRRLLDILTICQVLESAGKSMDLAQHEVLLIHTRLCAICRKVSQQSEMFRLTVDHISNQVCLNDSTVSKSQAKRIFGRSAYLCRGGRCVSEAAKNHRLKLALEGRRIKGVEPKRRIAWPLEPQLIQLISSKCTEPLKTCQNTER
jgi:predicted RNA-binding protein YlxR (DUF448 family)